MLVVSNEPHNGEMKIGRKKKHFEQDLGDFVNALNDIRHSLFLGETISTFPNFYHNLTVTADLISLN